MKKTHILSIVTTLFLAFATASCTNDGENTSKESVGTTTGNYFPMAVENQWTYQIDDSKTGTTQIYGTDKFNGTTYYRLTDESIKKDMGQAWITKKGATYYQKTGSVNYTEDGSSMKMDGFEIVVLRDDLEVNQTWKGNYNINISMSQNNDEIMNMSMKVAYTGKILERDVTETVNGIEYKNVIKVNIEQTVSMGSESAVTSTVSWYAKDIGLIKSIQTSDEETTESVLVHHNLK